MSIERRCMNCGFHVGFRVNFGNNATEEHQFHLAFECPKCRNKFENNDRHPRRRN